MKEFKEYVSKKNEVKKLDKQIKDIKEEIKSLEVEMKDFCIENGINSLSIDGYKISLSENNYYSVVDTDSVVEQLSDQGYLDEVKNKLINPQAFNKLMKEYNLNLYGVNQSTVYRFSMRKA